MPTNPSFFISREQSQKEKEEIDYQNELSNWESEGGSLAKPNLNTEELEYQRDLERWESEGGSLGRVAQRVENVLENSVFETATDESLNPVQPEPTPVRPVRPLPRPTPIPVEVETNDLKKFIEALLRLIKDIDWKKVEKDLGGSFNSLIVSLIAIGDKELVNIPLPKLEEIKKLLDKYKEKLPKEQSEKINKQIENLLNKVREKVANKTEGDEISPEEWLRRERDKNKNYEEVIKNPAKGFIAPRGEFLSKNVLEQTISDLKKLLDSKIDPETRRRILRTISSLTLLITTLPFLSGSSPTSSRINGRDIYPNIYGNNDNQEQEIPAKEDVMRREVPDQGINEERIDILSGVSIQSGEQSLDLFGERIGSKIDIKGPNIISIENKTGDKSVQQEMTESKRKADYVIVAELNGERVLIDLQKYIEYLDGSPVIDLNKLPDAELALLRDNPLIWGDFGFENNQATSSFVQRGQITGISERAKKIINERIMDKVNIRTSLNRNLS